MTPKLEHLVGQYDAQRDGMAIVAGWEVRAEVTSSIGRKFTPVVIAVCPSKDDAEEIAGLLNEKYA